MDTFVNFSAYVVSEANLPSDMREQREKKRRKTREIVNKSEESEALGEKEKEQKNIQQRRIVEKNLQKNDRDD